MGFSKPQPWDLSVDRLSPMKGTTMRLQLPTFIRKEKLLGEENSNGELGDKGHMQSSTCSVSPKAEQKGGHYKTILVVDDSTTCRKMVARLLRSMSFSCLEAVNGSECVEMIHSLNKHAMIKTNLNVLKEDIDYFKQSGVDAVITKPYVQQDFVQMIQNY